MKKSKQIRLLERELAVRPVVYIKPDGSEYVKELQRKIEGTADWAATLPACLIVTGPVEWHGVIHGSPDVFSTGGPMHVMLADLEDPEKHRWRVKVEPECKHDWRSPHPEQPNVQLCDWCKTTRIKESIGPATPWGAWTV